MFSTLFFKKFAKIISTIVLIMLLIYTLYILNNFDYTNLSASADGIQSILRDLSVSSADQNVGLPKIDRIDEADEKTNHILYKFIEILLNLAGILAVVFIIIGGMEYTVSAGDSDRVNGAKAKIMYATLGLLAVIFSYAIFTNGINFLEVAEK